jgi:hypothetical protein
VIRVKGDLAAGACRPIRGASGGGLVKLVAVALYTRQQTHERWAACWA